MKTISIATDFSKTPATRFEEEGMNPGAKFREDILYPALKDAIESGEKLEVVLDGTAGLGTSFLEESFGGLIRVNRIKYEDIKNHLVLIAKEDPDYIDEINEYLNDAYKNEEN